MRSAVRRASRPLRAGLPLFLLCTSLPAQVPALSTSAVQRYLQHDAQCAQMHIVGQCFCASVPCGLRIEQYVPVAVVETTRGAGDTLLGDPLGHVPAPAPGTVSSSLAGTDNTAEAHVWSLPAGPIPGVPCLGCAAIALPLAVGSADASARACGPAAAVARALAAPAAGAGSWLPTLSYASEVDAFNWRTGCRDLADPAIDIALLQLRCAAATAVAATAPGAAPKHCLLQWGLMVPRQMRDIGATPPLHSAKTALRAMSIAREQLGTFAHPVDMAGRLQQVYPVTSACFPIGRLPLPRAPAARPVQRSADGRYAWVYWRPTACCLGAGSIGDCLHLH